MNFSIDNNTGDASFGFSGENKLTAFNFVSGRMYDPEGRYFCSYTPNEPHGISGSISGENYNYYLNSKPINFKGSKEDFQIENFFWDANNCTMSATAEIKSALFDYEINLDSGFYEQPDGSWNLTGKLVSADGASKFRIFSGEMISPPDFNVKILDTSSVISSDIKVEVGGPHSVWDSYPIDFNLHTNFGVLKT